MNKKPELPLSIKLIGILLGMSLGLPGLFLLLLGSGLSDCTSNCTDFFEIFLIIALFTPGLILGFLLLKRNKIAWLLTFLGSIIIFLLNLFLTPQVAPWGAWAMSFFIIPAILCGFTLWKLIEHRGIFFPEKK